MEAEHTDQRPVLPDKLPDLVPYTLRIGVTGHRNLLDEAGAVKATEQALLTIRTLLESAAGDPCHPLTPGYSSWRKLETLIARQVKKALLFANKSQPLKQQTTDLNWLVVSSLAKGADRIVARVAMGSLNATLETILPFSADDYREDFNTKADLDEFNELFQNDSHSAVFPFEEKHAPLIRAEGYLHAGEKVVESCEILIAIWDGEPAKGMGGTAEIVEYATQLNRTVVWINSTTPQKPIVLIKKILKENDHSFQVITEAFPRQAVDLSPSFVQLAEYNRDRAFRRKEYNTTYARNRDRLEEARTLSRLPAPVIQPLLKIILPHYAKADLLANKYKVIYERAAAWLYRLVAIAVMVAVMQSLIFPDQTGWIVLELLSLVSAFIWFRWSRLENWHEKWLNYRHLAERLRILTFSSLVIKKETGKKISPEEHLPFYPGPGAWVLEVFDHIRSELPSVAYSDDELEAVRQFVLKGWIDHQEKFHAGSARKKAGKAKDDHMMIGFMLVLTIAAATVHILKIFDNRILEHLVTAVAIILPAFASAMHAISVIRDRERISARYARMAEILNRLKRTIGDAPDFDALYREIRNAEDIMSTENHEWCVSLSFRRINLPV